MGVLARGTPQGRATGEDQDAANATRGGFPQRPASYFEHTNEPLDVTVSGATATTDGALWLRPRGAPVAVVKIGCGTRACATLVVMRVDLNEYAGPFFGEGRSLGLEGKDVKLQRRSHGAKCGTRRGFVSAPEVNL